LAKESELQFFRWHCVGFSSERAEQIKVWETFIVKSQQVGRLEFPPAGGLNFVSFVQAKENGGIKK